MYGKKGEVSCLMKSTGGVIMSNVLALSKSVDKPMKLVTHCQ